MARRVMTRSRIAPRRRETVWFADSATSTTIAGASTAVLVASLNAAALAFRPFTIVRVRGFWHVRSDQIVANEPFGGSLGWAVVSDQSVAIGVTAVPTPETDRDSDLWHVFEIVYGTAGSTGENALGIHGTFDSKAMRRVDVGQDSIVCLETPSTSSSGIFHMSARFLIKAN